MSDQASHLDSLFAAAVEIESAAERATFLDQACGENHQLRGELERLLHSDEQAKSFLERPPAELGATILTSPENPDRAAAMEAGLAPAFAQEQAVVLGDGNHSVLKMLAQTLGNVSRVALRDSVGEGADPIVRPRSAEMPKHDSDSRYRLDGEIARGGMGAILKGRDTDLGRDLAIKVLLDAHKNKPEVVQRFVEEAQIGGQLQHPGIAPIYELGQFADKRPFFAMKLVKGETLSKLLADRKDPVAERGKFIGIFEQICQTMAYAHSRGVIHRDLKPANIMVGAFGEVQVMDWGLAKVLQVGGVADEKKSQVLKQGQSIIQTLRSGVGSDSPGVIGSVGSHTQMGSVMGTPAYMPPEQALGEIDRMDERADVFGLGAILCEILTGKPPYVADDGTQVYRMASRGKLKDAFERLDSCGADADLIQLTKDCLKLEPADRPRDAGMLSERVTGYLESVEARLRETERQRAAESARASESRKRARVTIALAATILLSLGIGTASWRRMELQAIHRREVATRQVNTALNEALLHESRGETGDLRDQVAAIDKAVASAQQAVKFAEQEDVDLELRSRALELSSGLETRASSLHLLAETTRRDEQLFETLEQIRLSQAGGGASEETVVEAFDAERINSDGQFSTQSEENQEAEPQQPRLKGYRSFDMAMAAKSYEQAFQEAGIDFASLTAQQAAELIRGSAIRESLLSALDNWARVLPASPSDVSGPLEQSNTDEITREKLLDIANAADPSDWRKQLREALAMGDTKRLETLSREDEVNRQSLELITWLGAALREAKLLDDSVRVLRNAQQLNPGDFWLNHELAGSLVEQGSTVEGLGFARAAVAIRPKSVGALAGLCAHLEMAKQYQEFEVVARRALKLAPTSAVAVNRMGDAYYYQQNTEMAIAEFRKASQLDPEYDLPLINIARIREWGKDYEEAIAAYRRVIEVDPGNAEAHTQLGYCLQQTKQFQEAIAECRRGVELAPGSFTAHNGLATALVALGERAEAVAAYRRAIELEPANHVVRANLSVSLRSQGRLDEAIEELQKAFEMNPQYDAARNMLRDALRARAMQRAADGKQHAALADFRQAFELSRSRDQKERVLRPLQLFPKLLESFAHEHLGDRQVQLARLAAPADEDGAANASETRTQMLLEIEQELLANPKNASAAHDLADLLLQPEVTQWQTLVFTELQGAGGTALTQLPDGSVMAGRRLGLEEDQHVLVAASLPRSIAAVRLELIPDTSLPGCGPGRGDQYASLGSPQLKEFRLLIQDADNELISIGLVDAVASHEGDDRQATNAIDGDESSTWNVWGRTGEWNAAIFRPERPFFVDDSQKLVISVHDWHGNPLGRFRVTVTDDVDAYQREADRFAAMRQGDPWKKLAAAYHARGSESELDQLLASHPEKTQMLADLNADYGNWEKAISGYSKLIENSPGNDLLLIKRATAYVATEQFDLADRDLRRAFELKPTVQTADEIAKNERWPLALDVYSRLIASATSDVSLLRKRAKAYVGNKQPGLAIADLERALEISPEEENALELADLLLSQLDEAWTVLHPTEMNSIGGATLTLLDDGSVLASGNNTVGDAYTVVAEADPMRVTAIRLEALTDPSLPLSGPGRAPNRDTGNFFITNWEVSSLDADGDEVPIPLQSALASNSRPDWPITVTSWNITGFRSRPSTATYLLQVPIEFEQRLKLKFLMQFFDNQDWPLQNLGRFRISVSGDPNAFLHAQATIDTAKFDDPWQKLAAAYVWSGKTAALKDLLEDHPEVVVTIAETQLAAGQFQQAIATCDSIITPENEDAHLLAYRGRAYAGLQQWDQAKADWFRAAERQPEVLEPLFNEYQNVEDWTTAGVLGMLLVERQSTNDPLRLIDDSILWLKVGAVLAMAGDTDTYSRFCALLTRRHPHAQEWWVVARICHACLLMPDSIAVPETPYKSLGTIMDTRTDLLEWESNWGWSTLALAAYRDGEPELALDYVKRSEEYHPSIYCHAMNLGILALAHHELRNAEAAANAREDLKEIVSGFGYMEMNQDQLFPKILLREAEELLPEAERANP
jgi:serine/threonine protein kinase/Flp pilus assembly protein TadD